MLHEPSYVAYTPAIIFAGGVAGARADARRATTSRSTRPRSRRPSRRAPRCCSWATPATPPAPCSTPATAPGRSPTSPQRHDLLVISDEIYDRLVYGDHRHEAFSALPGHARPDDPAGRLLQGLRHDRLARRLRLRAARTSSRASSRSTSTRSCRRPRRPRTRRSRRSPAPSRTCSGWSPSTTAAGSMFVDGLNAHRPADRSSRTAPSTPSRDIAATRPDAATQFSERLLFEQQVAVVPGDAFGPSGEGYVRACYATSYEQLEEALVRIERFVRFAGRALRPPATAAGTRRSSASRSTSSCGPRPRCSAAAPPTSHDAAAQHAHLPGLPGPAGRAAGHQPARRASTCWRPASPSAATAPEVTRWDRKNYFYPDLPKGYQISQYDLPLALARPPDGRDVDGPGDGRHHAAPTSRRTRRGSSTPRRPTAGAVSLVDFNRSGMPLMEIVTEPDIHTAEAGPPLRRGAAPAAA